MRRIIILALVIPLAVSCVTKRQTKGGAVYTLPDDEDDPKQTERVWIWRMFN